MISLKQLPQLAATLLAACLLLNCASRDPLPSGFPPPEVWVTNIQPQGMTLMSTDILVDLRIDNEDIEPIQLLGAVHKFYINGEYLGKGTSNQPVAIAGLGSANQQVMAHASNLKFIGGVDHIINAPKHHCVIRSTLHFLTTDGRRRRAQVENGSEVDLSGLRMPGFGQPQAPAPQTAPRLPAARPDSG